MPKASHADWNLAQVLYVQGVAYKAIAEKVGVTEAALRQRAHRYRWPALKTAALETVSRTVTGHTGKTLVERSSEVRSALAEDIGESVSALRQTPVKPHLQHLQERAGVAEKITATANRVFGWNSDDRAVIVFGASLLGQRPILDAEDASAEQKTIVDAPLQSTSQP